MGLDTYIYAFHGFQLQGTDLQRVQEWLSDVFDASDEKYWDSFMINELSGSFVDADDFPGLSFFVAVGTGRLFVAARKPMDVQFQLDSDASIVIVLIDQDAIASANKFIQELPLDSEQCKIQSLIVTNTF